MDIDRICSTNKALHPATCSDEDRVSYLRKFVDRILHQILSLDDLQCAPAVAIAVEMLVTQVTKAVELGMIFPITISLIRYWILSLNMI